MGTKSNVNPNQYKTAGRERQGEDIVQAAHKAKLTTQPGGAGRKGNLAAGAERPGQSRRSGGMAGSGSKQQGAQQGGMRSTSQKMAAARHDFDTIPAAQPVPGASGRRGRADVGGGPPRTRRRAGRPSGDQSRSAGRKAAGRRRASAPARAGKRA